MTTKKDEKTLETVVEVASESNAPAAPVMQPENVTQVENVEPVPDALQSLDALAAKYRVPGWQAAALNRFMDWEPGKMVSEVNFVCALHSLDARRMGSGGKE